MVLFQKLHEAPRTVYAFIEKENRVLTVPQFIITGDDLIDKCPNWTWEPGEPSKRKPYLPPEKQFLITKDVPCLRRAVSIEKEYEAARGEVLLDVEDNDGWLATYGKVKETKSDEDEDMETLEIEDDEDIPDMAEFSEYDGIIETDPSTYPVAHEPDDDNILQTRTYDISITYDKYYRTPRVWLTGYDESRMLLQPELVLEDVSQDHACKTVSIEDHPHLPGKHASIHPCRHGAVMKKIIDLLMSRGVEPEVENALPWWRWKNMNECVRSEGDMINNLPEEMLLNILSMLETREAIQRTRGVSRAWHNIWKVIPTLNLNSDTFETVAEFDDFVMFVLSERGSSPMTALIYRRHGKTYKTNQALFEKVITYAVSHGVEDVQVDLRRSTNRSSSKVEVPTVLLHSKSLKRLEFSYCSFSNINRDRSSLLGELSLLRFIPWSTSDNYPLMFLSKPLGVNFRQLTTLHLNKLSLKYKKNEPVSPFSQMLYLEKLHLSEISIGSYPRAAIPKKLMIHSPKLRELQLTCNNFKCRVKIVASMLKNLVYLHSALWTDFKIRFPSIQEGLVIDIKEYKEAETTTNHTLVKLKWTRQEGDNVKVSQHNVEVRCSDAPFINWKNVHSRNDILTECGEGSTTTL